MKSSELVLDPRRRSYVRLVGDIRHALHEALAEEGVRRGLTQARLAELMGRNKSFVSRKLGGGGNMTIETLAELAHAMDRRVSVSLVPREAAPGSNAQPSPGAPAPTTSSGPALQRDSGDVLSFVGT